MSRRRNEQSQQWGNSLAVRIPADLAKTLDLKKNDQIEVTVRDDFYH
ncbi:AbrB/MazE/SpoVT family DNA-binding domain-containing protein [Caballeronia sordidicola]|nr:AbrB/MazE/SpoVT family DNA-binding domain-containing protein [Caballeronia sordidicola]